MDQVIEVIFGWGEFLGDVRFREPSIWGLYTPIFWIGIVLGLVGDLLLIRFALKPTAKVTPVWVFVYSFLILFCTPTIFGVALSLLSSLLESIEITGPMLIVALGLCMLYKKLKVIPSGGY